jgi:hypothetical protein
VRVRASDISQALAALGGDGWVTKSAGGYQFTGPQA